jgi:hypothetical protein
LINGFLEKNTLKELGLINAYLRTGSIKWSEDFINENGIEILLSSLSKSMEILSETTRKMQFNLIISLKRLLNTTFGLEKFLDEKDSLRSLVVLLDTPYVECRSEIFSILGALASFSGFLKLKN